ncbi:MAG: sugar transferase [Planctomycetes bacterium]|nr:sugar transferase [Planctomycetota bacterium]
MIKRLFDIAASLILTVILGPLMLLIAVAIRLESPGGAIFRQRRAGLRGAAFTMLKFRTMHAEVDAYAPSPHGADDERLTRIGRFLRETSLDELPQLFNVLGGTMSLVGPRPLYERQAAQWDANQRRRLDVRPGITGYAQAYGRGKITIEEKIEMDLYYVDHGGFRMDMKILLRTIANVFVRRGEVYEKRYSRDSEYEDGREE